MASNLRKKTVKGLAWSTIDNFVSLGISFIFSIILARILGPEAYATVALLTIFIAVANTFVNSGFASALIRKPDRTEKDNATTFYFNIAVGTVCYLLLFIGAPWVADFYDEPVLTPLLRVVSLCVLFNSLCIVQQAQLTIRIDFKTQAFITIVCTLLSGLLGLLLAYRGWGVWSLAFQQVSSSLLRTILLWGVVRWYPRAGFSTESFHQLFGFGAKLLASGLLDTIYNNAYSLIIGKVFSFKQLGFYNRAESLAALPSSNITAVLQRVTFPVLSQMQDDDERLAVNYRRILRTSAFIIFPLMMILAGVASPLVRLLLTEKWSGCILYLQILCFAMMWYPIHAINLNLLQVKGRSDLFLKLEIVKKIIGITILVITIPMGLVTMCYGRVLTSVLCLVVNTYYTGKIIHVGFLLQMKDLLPIMMNAFVTYFVCLLPFSVYQPAAWIQIPVLISIGAASYLLISKLYNANELEEVLYLFQKGRD